MPPTWYHQWQEVESQCQPPQPDYPINVGCKTIRKIVPSALEADITALFFNARNAIPFRYFLQAIGH